MAFYANLLRNLNPDVGQISQIWQTAQQRQADAPAPRDSEVPAIWLWSVARARHRTVVPRKKIHRDKTYFIYKPQN